MANKIADSVNSVTVGLERPRTSPTEYLYHLHISSYSDVPNAGSLYTNDSTFSISVTAAHANTPEANESGHVDGREFWEQCLIAVVLSSIALTAMIGNVLVIAAVWRYRRLRSVTNCFVVSLALADLLVSILVLPLNIVVEVTGQWLFGSILCDLWISSDVLLCTSSILNLCCISLDRYFAITRPLIYSTRRNKRLAVFMVAVAWLLAAVVTCPPIFGWKEEGRDLADGCLLTRDPGYIIYSACGSFFIPLLVMLFVYARIYHVARKREKRLRPYWRTVFDGHQRRTVCRRQFATSSSTENDNEQQRQGALTPLPSANDCPPIGGVSRSNTPSLPGTSVIHFIRRDTSSSDKEGFDCHTPQKGYGNEQGFLRKFKSSFRRYYKTRPRRYHNTTTGTTKTESGSPAQNGNDYRRSDLHESSDVSTGNNRSSLTNSSSSSSGSSSSGNESSNNNNKTKQRKNKRGLLSSCYPQLPQSRQQPQLCRINDSNNGSESMTGRDVTLTSSMTQASIPLLAQIASFNDEFNSPDDDKSTIILVDMTTNRDDENKSPRLSSPQHGHAVSCNLQQEICASKTTTSNQSDNVSGGQKPTRTRRPLHSATPTQRASYVRSDGSTGAYKDRVRLRKRLCLDRRRIIPRKYITSISSRRSRLSLRSRRPTLEVTPPSPSPGSNRPLSTLVPTSNTTAAVTTTTNTATCASGVTNTHRNTRSRSTFSRLSKRFREGSEEASAAENRRRNRVVERSLYMKERKTAKTLAIVVGCFVVCWLPFFLIYVIDVFCAHCHVTPTLFSALTWLGYFNSALNPLIYALYNTGFRHAFWNLTFGLCFPGGNRRSNYLPSVTSHGGRTMTTTNVKSTFASGASMK